VYGVNLPWCSCGLFASAASASARQASIALRAQIDVRRGGRGDEERKLITQTGAQDLAVELKALGAEE
jgi:hypothetical protein